MRAGFAVGFCLAGFLLGFSRMATAADFAQCPSCQDACAAQVHKCYHSMCVKSDGQWDDGNTECQGINPKKLTDYTNGYATCRTASAACQAKCVSDKLCAAP